MSRLHNYDPTTALDTSIRYYMIGSIANIFPEQHIHVESIYSLMDSR